MGEPMPVSAPAWLLVIGAQRCGTTYLAELLEAHPGIAVARPRRPEPKWFLSQEQADAGVDVYVDRFFGHREHESVLVEKSTSYLDHPEAGARADAVLAGLRILAQLRDPVARAVSHWRFSSEHGVEQRPLAQALGDSIAAESAWDTGRFSTSPFAYLSRGCYAEELGPWLGRFGSRMRVQFLEELAGAGPAGLLEWLDVEPMPSSYDASGRVNASSGPAPDLPAALLADLRHYYAEPDARLRELLGRSLPWDGDPR